MRNITQELTFRQRMMEYLQHHGASETAHRFHVCRKTVWKYQKHWDGTSISLLAFQRQIQPFFQGCLQLRAQFFWNFRQCGGVFPHNGYGGDDALAPLRRPPADAKQRHGDLRVVPQKQIDVLRRHGG